MKKIKKFSHLNQTKRDRLQALLDSGHNQKQIANVLKVNPSTISREIKHRKRINGYYDADTAQHKANVKRLKSKYRGKKVEQNRELREYIIRGLKQYRSPDEIAGRMKKEKQSFCINKDAIYGWLYSCWGQQYCRYLCSKRYRKRKQKKNKRREMIPDRISISDRPHKGIHAEGDTFVSPKRFKTTISGVLVCIPNVQLLIGQKIENRRPQTMVDAINHITKDVLIDDITFDNGIENKYHKQFNLSAYFCDPHSPWQKPHVENNIGLLRRWFMNKKKTNLKKVSDDKLQRYLYILNNKYRKSLGYTSAYEAAVENGIIKSVPLTS